MFSGLCEMFVRAAGGTLLRPSLRVFLASIHPHTNRAHDGRQITPPEIEARSNSSTLHAAPV
jgi:hypothetical protein